MFDGSDLRRHLEAIGLLLDVPVAVERRLDGSGAMRLRVDGRAVTVAEGTAAAVWVAP